MIKLHKGIVYGLACLATLWLGSGAIYLAGSAFIAIPTIITFLVLLGVFLVLAITHTFDTTPVEYFEINWSQEDENGT
jgi:uncharacterized membrane protein YhiD involved in acid resistance